MKDITSNESLDVPEGVTVSIKARKITVEGPRGTLVKHVGHIQMDINMVSPAVYLQRVSVGGDEGEESTRPEVAEEGREGPIGGMRRHGPRACEAPRPASV